MEYRVVVLGGKGVGKTSLCERFVNDDFQEEVDITIEDRALVKRVEMAGEEPCKVKVIDTAFHGSEGNLKVLSQAYVVCFSLLQRTSFDEVPTIVERMHSSLPAAHREKPLPIVLVGCKKDLAEFKPATREVTPKEGKKLAKQIGASSYFECSSRDGSDVEAAFEAAVRSLFRFMEGAVGGASSSSGDKGCVIS